MIITNLLTRPTTKASMPKMPKMPKELWIPNQRPVRMARTRNTVRRKPSQLLATKKQTLPPTVTMRKKSPVRVVVKNMTKAAQPTNPMVRRPREKRARTLVMDPRPVTPNQNLVAKAGQISLALVKRLEDADAEENDAG